MLCEKPLSRPARTLAAGNGEIGMPALWPASGQRHLSSRAEALLGDPIPFSVSTVLEQLTD